MNLFDILGPVVIEVGAKGGFEDWHFSGVFEKPNFSRF